MDALPHPGFAKAVDFALVLGGGNALGAYQAGVYQALHEHGLEPDCVVGASVGALNGALICGNPREDRLDRLRDFWKPAGRSMDAGWPAGETMRRTAAATATLAGGHPPAFVPRAIPGAHWLAPAGTSSSLYDTAPLGSTIERLVDFELLNSNQPRFAATAVDLGTGEDILFDTASTPVEVAHLLASSALLPAFPAVPIDERLFCDAGFSSNLPVDVVLAETSSRPLLCMAVDLLPLRAPPPSTIGEVTERAQDLMFATQSRRAIAAWQALFDQSEANGDARAVTLLQIVYEHKEDEVSGKAFDFSPETVRARWAVGYRDGRRALDAVSAGDVILGKPGLHVYARSPGEGDGALQRIRRTLAPRSPSAQA